MNNQKILNGGSKNGPIRGYLTPEDLVILIQDVVDSHPGLGFLKEATEFHSRYVHTVSQYTKIYHIYRMKCTIIIIYRIIFYGRYPRSFKDIFHGRFDIHL